MTRVLAEFRQLWGDIDALRWLVVKRLEFDPERVARRSRETTTHYKWLLASDRSQGSKIWFHEFKPACERRPGYASTIHNHRYPFASVALRGGYTNLRFDVCFEESSLRVHRCDLVQRECILEGSRYRMEPDEYHCVDDIADGTQTLVLELPAINPVSYSVDRFGDRVTEHVPLEVRINDLLHPRSLLLSPRPT